MHYTPIPLEQRRPDDGVVDMDAIDMALRGHEQYVPELSRREIGVAVHVGRGRNMSHLAIAEALLLHERQVARIHRQRCPVEVAPVCPDDLADFEDELAAA